MKGLVFTDLHVDAVTAGFRRADDVASGCSKVVDTAIAEKVDFVLNLGDLCDPDSGAGTLRGVECSLSTAFKLSSAKIWSYWIAGNHDVLEDGSGRTTLTPLASANLPYVMVLEREGPLIVLAPGVNLVALPYVSRAMSYGPSKFVDDLARKYPTAKDDEFWIFAGHLQLTGAKLGSETEDMPRGRDVAFPTLSVRKFRRRLCLNGHYHQRQTVGEVIIPGSLERLSHGEEKNEPGYMLIEV